MITRSGSPLDLAVESQPSASLRPAIQIDGMCGLGDHIFMAGAVRWLAAVHERVILDVESFQLPDLSYLYRDISNVILRGKMGDRQGGEMAVPDLPRVVVGVRPGRNSRIEEWLYAQLGLPMLISWANWHCPRDYYAEQTLRQALDVRPGERFAFVHDDAPRGFAIDRRRIDPTLRIVHPGGTRCRPRRWPLFAWLGILEEAAELHCIESSFAALIDRSPSIAGRLVFHRYPRQHPDEQFKSVRRRRWEVLH